MRSGSLSGARPRPSRSSSSSFSLPTTTTRPASPLRRLTSLPSHVHALSQRVLTFWASLSPRGKALSLLLALVYLFLLLTLARLGTHGLLRSLGGLSSFFAASPTLGPVLLLLLIAALSFPPTVGYGTAITLCGLTYGSPAGAEGNSLAKAWAVAAGGCMLGATLAFLGCRVAVNQWGSARWAWVAKVRQAKEWRAMERAVEVKGWRMVILVRFCPFPFVYSNLFFASLRPHVVPLPLFLLATALTTPKLLLHVFIGAQAYEAIHGGSGGGSDAPGPGSGGDSGSGTGSTSPAHASTPGLLSLAYILAAMALGMGTSWYIYAETKRVLEEFMLEEGDGEGEGGGGGAGQGGDESREEGEMEGLVAPQERERDRYRDGRSEVQPETETGAEAEVEWEWSDEEGERERERERR